jgi:hypothetical protein
MLLVPKQLQRAGMTGDVPYYGGRFSPAQAYAASHRSWRPPNRPEPSTSAAMPQADTLLALQHLRDAGVLTPEEYTGGVQGTACAGHRMMGPVQVLVVGFDRPTFSGEVLAEFTRLREAGIVRLVDLLLVSRAESGALETLAAPSGMGADLGELTAALLGQPEGEASGVAGMADADSAEATAWSLADAVPAGSVAAVALIEHIWAGPLNAAIQRAGGSPLDETWLAPSDLDMLEALIAQREA